MLDATVVGVLVARHFLPGGIEGLYYQPTYIGLGEIGRDTHLVSVLTIGQKLDGLLAGNRMRWAGIPEKFEIHLVICRSGRVRKGCRTQRQATDFHDIQRSVRRRQHADRPGW
ncbi:DUF4094 domain-containing protein [Xanthomonas euvesicatoria]